MKDMKKEPEQIAHTPHMVLAGEVFAATAKQFFWITSGKQRKKSRH